MSDGHAYYNEIEPFCASWLSNLMDADLIARGHIDTRSITDVQPADLAGYERCHFFAGIAGWDYALQLAGWPSDWPVWTGSCPCQPFSAAGKRKGVEDERHLWPEFFRLIRECRPNVVFGEQVPRAIGHGWLDEVSSDLEAEGYAVGACVLGAHSVNSSHYRYRLYFVAHTMRKGLEGIYTARRGVDLQSTEATIPRDEWKATPRVLKRANGFSRKLDKPGSYRGQVRAYGNAIVPQVAAVFIRAFMETLQ